jgi:hypothetical protein
MSKKLPDVNAKPFDVAVDEIAPQLNKMLDAKRTEDAQIFDMGPLDGRDGLIKTLKTMVNPDVCLTDEQQKRLFTDMREYLKNPDQTKLLALVAVINSYRTECLQCLAKSCSLRDIQ